MEANQISDKLKALWAANVDKNSGSINKRTQQIDAIVMTEYGYLRVIDVIWNSELKKIQLVLS